MREPNRNRTKPAASAPMRARAPRRARRTGPSAVEVGGGEDPRIILGRVLHRHRLRLGISQEDLADRVGLDRTYVSGIERGVRNPTLLVLLRLADALGVAPAALLEEQRGAAAR